MNIGQFRNFVQNFSKMNKDPRAVVQELLNNGQMSQAQFNALAAQVDKIMGKQGF